MAANRSIRGGGFRSRWRIGFLIVLLAGICMPSGVGAQVATPGSTSAPPLQELLGLLPEQFSNSDDLSNPIIYAADIAQQLEAIGMIPPKDLDAATLDQWFAATLSLMVPSHAAQYLRSWRVDYGFDLLQAEQTLSFSAPPFDLSIYRGTFDTDEVMDTLASVGYAQVEVGGRELMSIRGDYEMDLDAATTYKMAAMNFGVVLDPRTIAFSSAGAPLAQVLDVMEGLAPSAMDNAGFATLVEAAPVDLVSAVIVPGTMLAGSIPPGMFDIGVAGTPDLNVIATQIASTSEMPPVVLALLGSTAGGPLPSPLVAPDGVEDPFADVPDARAIAIALMPSPALAQASVPIVQERLATGSSLVTNRPYTELFADSEVRAERGQPILQVELTLEERTRPRILVDMLVQRDLVFLAW